MDVRGQLSAVVESMTKHVGKVLFGVASLGALYILWSIALRIVNGCEGCAGSAGLWAAAVVVSVLVVGHFVSAFTRNLPSSNGNEHLRRELRTIFIYGYLLQGLALGTGLLLLVGAVHWVPDGKLGGLVYGCQDSEKGYGSDLAWCGNDEPVRQWLLHIGSRAERPFEAKVEKDLLEALNQACDADSPKGAIGEAIGKFDGSVGQGAVSAVAAACEGVEINRPTRIKESLLVNGVVSRWYKLRGGLIVPLYVVVLSVMGAAVGMSRRLPEIQRKAAHSAQSLGKGISAIEARERVVFQIMQVLAAPLIAVTAFAAFEPDTVTAAVLIGFTSGFASEAVLIKLRQASEALTRERSETR